MNDSLQYVGLTHQSAPLPIRENVRVDAEKLRTLLSRLGSFVDGRLVLATCERFEIYATTRHASNIDWASALSQWFHVPAALLVPRLRKLVGSDAAGHLFRVAAGLESRIVGEAQILGQVRDAFVAAQEMNALDAELSALARSAIRAGKRVRHETDLGAGRRSIATIVLDALAEDVRGRKSGQVAVLGTGRLAEVVLAELQRRGVDDRLVLGRDHVRVNELALRFDTQGETMAALPVVLASADALIVCTAAMTHVVDASLLPRRRLRPLRLFDLSVPRNVDPAVEQFPYVQLRHLDALVSEDPMNGCLSIDNRQSAIGNHPHARAHLDGTMSASAERIIDEESTRFLLWRRQRAVAPLIAQLVESSAHSGSMEKRELHRRIERLKAQAAA